MFPKSILNSNCNTPLFTDLYQFKMAYAYWRSGKHNDHAVFDVYFRENPFGGEFTIFSGLSEVLEFIYNFSITNEDINYLRKVLPPHVNDEFYEYLKNLSLKDVKIYSIPEGYVTFPNVPLIIVEGPLAGILNFVNFSSLVATNATHFRLLAGNNCILAEYGCRRAQGPNGAMVASVNSYIGGFDYTSNLLCGKCFNMPVAGTVAHSFISSFMHDKTHNEKIFSIINKNTGKVINLLNLALEKADCIKNLLNPTSPVEAELKSFVAFACAYPDTFQAVVDTYNVLKSGIVNFCATSLALADCGYQALGVRIDSGDLSFFSQYTRRIFKQIANNFNIPWFGSIQISVSNEIGTEKLSALNRQGHEIDAFGIGNQLVTCTKQSSLGVVFKLVEINGSPTVKLTEDNSKSTIPFRKSVYRLFNSDGIAIMDLIKMMSEESPKVGEKVLCKHPFKPITRVYVIPSKVEHLHRLYFESGKILIKSPNVHELKKLVSENLSVIRDDHKRYLSPNPYKVSLSPMLYDSFHNFLQSIIPIEEIS